MTDHDDGARLARLQEVRAGMEALHAEALAERGGKTFTSEEHPPGGFLVGAAYVRVEVTTLRDDAATRYSQTLAAMAEALPTSLESAREVLAPIAGEVWTGRLTLHGATAPGDGSNTSRRVSDATRAQVFIRDGFLCSHCGGRTVPRCVLVAVSDVFPDEFPYYAHYRRGTVHPAYWALAPEADHVLAHASGGSSDAANLTTLHAMCNTGKSSLAVASLPAPTAPSAPAGDWDGLLPRYADIIRAGELTGRRHSSEAYHPSWLRRFGRLADLGRTRAEASR